VAQNPAALPVPSGNRLPVRTGSLALGMMATGAVAIGAVALGALAIGRLAVGPMAMRDLARLRGFARLKSHFRPCGCR